MFDFSVDLGHYYTAIQNIEVLKLESFKVCSRVTDLFSRHLLESRISPHTSTKHPAFILTFLVLQLLKPPRCVLLPVA
jgi:hypothetical protein